MTVGMVKPDEGHVFLDDKEITELPMYQRARKGVGYLPQEASIFRKLTVKQNVMAILEIHGPASGTGGTGRQASGRTGDQAAFRQKASVLSGGERRRLEITRCLVTNPSFILLDEPFAGIDPLAVIDIKKIIDI